MMKILKFGGSSVATPDAIRQVWTIVKEYYRQGETFSFVVSAFGGVTDKLLAAAHAAAGGSEEYREIWQALKDRHFEVAASLLDGNARDVVEEKLTRRFANLLSVLEAVFAIREVSPRTKDYIVSFGERNSAFVIAHYLKQQGLPAEYLDARKVLLTDSGFGGANVVKEESYGRIRARFEQLPGVYVITGFIGADANNTTTTLGRGGSDYTAALFGAALGADAIEIWTDVDGILTADPRVVRDAHTLKEVTYVEAMEMSHFGAKVIYPPTIQPALEAGIPIFIRNTFNPDFEGTKISAAKTNGGELITGMASIGNVVLLTLHGSGMVGVPGFAARLFGCLAKGGVNIIMITQGSSEHAISFAVTPQEALTAQALVEEEFELEIARKAVAPVKVESELCIVAIIGESIKTQHNISGRLFGALGTNGINVVAIAQGSSELIISVVISKNDEKKALNAIHETFFRDSVTRVHLFMVGAGLVGKRLLKQIGKQNDILRKEHQMEIVLAGLANRSRMLLDATGINPAGWQEALAQGEPSDLATFVKKMIELNLRNSVFVDATAGEQVPSFYDVILQSNISISTPNKVAASSAYVRYLRLKQLAAKRGVQYLYETNVGAALPIISTIRDLVWTGDKIYKIEGVLSGTLSFIFGAYTPGRTFKEVVMEAKEKGFTEPDPRVDLGGIDVARKILILARETGLPLEMEDVEVVPILPENCMNAPDVEAFFEELATSEAHFAAMRDKASKAGKVLRMIATLEEGKCRVGVQEVGPESPFYALRGGDNMVAVSSKRYTPFPLVVRGPGAGAGVTAAGIFAEIVQVGKTVG